MGERPITHEAFRNLFKTTSGELPQTAVRPASKRRGKGSKSGFVVSKSTDKKSGGQRNKPSGKKSTNRKINSSTSNNLHTPPSKSPHYSPRHVKTAVTPSSPSPRKHGSTPPQQWNGHAVQQPTEKCNTIFENESGGSAEGGARHQLAEAKIKERKLQWMPSEQPKTGPRTAQEQSHSQDSAHAVMKMIPAAIPEANTTVRNRTVFENNDALPAPVKEEEHKLQWAPGAARETFSEPAVRKKKTEDPRGAISDRPIRDYAVVGVKPARGIPTIPTIPVIPAARTPPISPAKPPTGRAVTPAVTPPLSPNTRPVKLDVNAQAMKATPPGFGSAEKVPAFGSAEKAKNSESEKVVSCYLSPNMQQFH